MICRINGLRELEIRDLSVAPSTGSCYIRAEKSYYEVVNFIGDEIITKIEELDDITKEVTKSYSTYLEKAAITVTQEIISESSLNGNRDVVLTQRNAEIVSVSLEVPNVNKQIELIKDEIGMVNPESLSLEEYKAYSVTKSKNELAKYLLENPLQSDIHGNEMKSYSISENKQVLLLMEINMAKAAIDAKESYSPSWNATGEVCEPWTLEELVSLSFEMAEIVKPLVSYQQSLEEQIIAKESINEIMNLKFDYVSNDPRNKK